jgi:hypothetical protein
MNMPIGEELLAISKDIQERVTRMEAELKLQAQRMAIPADAQEAQCNKCGGGIYWSDSLTRKKRDGTTYKYPINPDGKAHWDTCPADERKPQRAESIPGDNIPF